MQIELDKEDIAVLIRWYEILDNNHFQMYCVDQNVKEKLEKMLE